MKDDVTSLDFEVSVERVTIVIEYLANHVIPQDAWPRREHRRVCYA
jgi:hypothetical protein